MKKIYCLFFSFALTGLGFYSGTIVVKEFTKDFGTVVFFSLICAVCLFGIYLLIKEMTGKKKLAKG